MAKRVEIVAPAGNLSCLKAALESGADAVYAGFNDETNARNFEGLNFTAAELEEGRNLLRKKGKKLYLAINTFPQAEGFSKWKDALQKAVGIAPDAIILADTGVLSYARSKFPDINIHLSVQASSSNYESINFYKKHFNIKRLVLPRVHTVEEVKELRQKTDVEMEVFALGGLCINIEGRCYLSSYVTGASTNTEGACSPSRFVRFENKDHGRLLISLNKTLLNVLSKDETSPYPTCCKGRYIMPDGRIFYAMEDPESLNAISILPGLIEAGISALKIEGRQRTKKYVSDVTSVLREAVDSYYETQSSYEVKEKWKRVAVSSFEGASQTTGAYGGK